MKKPKHGGPLPIWEQMGLNEKPDFPCLYRVGEKVLYTNTYGVKFVLFVVGFSSAGVHLCNEMRKKRESAWWFPHKLTEIQKMEGNA